MTTEFTRLEERLKLDQSETAQFLGITKSSYSQYKRGIRKTPIYIRYAIEITMLLSDRHIKMLKKERVYSK